MEEKSVKYSLYLMGHGLKMFTVCSCKIIARAIVVSLADLAKGMLRHPILALIIASIMAWQLYIIMTQRAERDQTALSSYKLEQKYDSAQIAADITQYRYEHRNDTTGSN